MTVSVPTPSALAVKPPSEWQQFVTAFLKNKGATAGLLVLALLVLSSVLAPWIAPYDPNILHAGKEQLPPMLFGGTSEFIFGTDDAGRDTLSRILHGSRYSLLIGLAATLIAMIVGVFLGLTAAFWPKSAGKLIMLCNDILMSYPGLLLAIIIAAILGPSMTNTILAISLVCMPPFIRITRATVLVELQKDYVTAARVMGAGLPRLMLITVLPNCMGPLIVQATMIFSTAILEAGAIGFLGLGVQPPSAEWGAMLGNARQYIQSNVWMAVFPGLAIFIAALSINLMGDGLRDALDPKLKQVS
ncbi:peptide transporter [Neisseria arctica]|uniref:Peptide transporter n=1 Tax=Neisseria arctica TaxID=1470200 RepID=A0A0J1C2Y5_9NEIS|nr:ABC transporter permease subunit [Neisseria arctica]KLT72678.1 peptide transporter [Neisseria arctica]UOO86235.1 ABC transporter permease subunit [Neisseria arctica]